MDYAALARESLDRVAASKPLIHQITNVVVTNDSANLTLAFGALPVMAYAPQEVAEMAAISQALVLNIGTLSEEEIAAMLLAGMAAGEKGIPIILDPVGAGATTFRTESALRLLRELPITVLRGNRGEIGALVGSGEVRGCRGHRVGGPAPGRGGGSRCLRRHRGGHRPDRRHRRSGHDLSRQQRLAAAGRHHRLRLHGDGDDRHLRHRGERSRIADRAGSGHLRSRRRARGESEIRVPARSGLACWTRLRRCMPRGRAGSISSRVVS